MSGTKKYASQRTGSETPSDRPETRTPNAAPQQERTSADQAEHRCPAPTDSKGDSSLKERATAPNYLWQGSAVTSRFSCGQATQKDKPHRRRSAITILIAWVCHRDLSFFPSCMLSFRQNAGHSSHSQTLGGTRNILRPSCTPTHHPSIPHTRHKEDLPCGTCKSDAHPCVAR